MDFTFTEGRYIQIILGMDNNDELHSSSGHVVSVQHTSTVPSFNPSHNGILDTLLRSTGLVNVLAHHQPASQYPATYNRGRKRIDLILVSASLLPAATCSGILPYNFLFQGDHRPCYINLNVKLAFDGKTPSICPPYQCTLQLHDPRIASNYLTALHKQFDYHKVQKKTELLYSIDPTEWTIQHQQEYEHLDRLITDSMLCAESCAAKKYNSIYEWSPALVRSVFAERIWRLAVMRSQGRSVSETLLSHTKESAGITVDLSRLTLPDIVQCLQSARQTRKEMQQQHQSLRKNYLENLAEALVLKRAPYLASNPKFDERLTKRTEKEVR